MFMPTSAFSGSNPGCVNHKQKRRRRKRNTCQQQPLANVEDIWHGKINFIFIQLLRTVWRNTKTPEPKAKANDQDCRVGHCTGNDVTNQWEKSNSKQKKPTNCRRKTSVDQSQNPKHQCKNANRGTLVYFGFLGLPIGLCLLMAYLLLLLHTRGADK